MVVENPLKPSRRSGGLTENHPFPLLQTNKFCTKRNFFQWFIYYFFSPSSKENQPTKPRKTNKHTNKQRNNQTNNWQSQIMETPSSHSSQMDILDEIFGSEWSAAQQHPPQHHHHAQQQHSAAAAAQQQQQQQQQQQPQQQSGGSLLMRVPSRLKVETTSTPLTSSVTTCLTPGPALSSMSSEFSPAAASSQDSGGDDASEHDVGGVGGNKPDFAADTTTPPPRRNSNNSIRGIHTVHPPTPPLPPPTPPLPPPPPPPLIIYRLHWLFFFVCVCVSLLLHFWSCRNGRHLFGRCQLSIDLEY